MPDFRISRKVFLWDIDLSTRYKNTWFNSLKTMLNNSGLSALINCTNNHDTISTKYVIESVKTKLVDTFKSEWTINVQNMPKLRTYKLLKTEFCTEPYVKKFLSRKQRSSIARIRCGTLPLEVERGRYRNIPADRRICKVCNSNVTEDEIHFLFLCNRYSVRRNELRRELISVDFDSPEETLKELLISNPKTLANFIIDCLKIRQDVI